MDNRYQIFVSSTYLDLKKARQELLHELLKNNYIPMGMELFPATSNGLPDYIKSVIDESDYYILIIGGRYGTIMKDDKGISYTEMEYEYAAEQGIPILVFTHTHPDDLDNKDPENKDKLDKFRRRVIVEREPGRWETAEKLALEVMRSLRAAPDRPGWVRAGKNDSAETPAKWNKAQEKNTSLKAENTEIKKEQLGFRNIAALDELCTIKREVDFDFPPYHSEDNFKKPWKEVFFDIAPYIENSRPHSEVVSNIHEIYDSNDEPFFVTKETIASIRIQFTALKLITYTDDSWKLTSAGKKLMYDKFVSRSCKSPAEKPSE